MADKPKVKPKHVAIGAGTIIGSVLGLLKPEMVVQFMGGAWRSEFLHTAILFCLAYWLIRDTMEKEFGGIREAINNVADKLSDDLALQQQQIKSMQNGLTEVIGDVKDLNTRVQSLEQPK